MIDTMGMSQDTIKSIFMAMNQVYEMEQKLKKSGDSANLQRNISKIAHAFHELGLEYEDPMGQHFSETRTDLDATIAGANSENLFVVEVVKPIIRYSGNSPDEFSRVVQKGIVIVKAQEEK